MAKPPKKWKMAILVWIAIYPVVTFLEAFFGQYFALVSSLPLRTLITTAIVVPLMVFLIMPLLEKLLTNWLKE